jgi:hypothetical protein
MVAISTSPPVGGLVPQDELLGPILLDGTGTGNGYGTMFWSIPNDTDLDGQTYYMQWLVTDPGAVGGVAASPVAELIIFCSMNGICMNLCPADMNGDGNLDFFDVSAFLTAFTKSDPSADFTEDGLFNFFDISSFLTAFSAGCP